MSNGVTEQRLQTICLLILAAIAIGAALYWLRPVLLPLALASAVHLSLTPVIDQLVRRLRLPSAMAVGVALVVAAGSLPLAGVLVAAAARRVARNADLYSRSFLRLAEDLGARFPLLRQAMAEQNLRERLAGLPVEDIIIGTTNAVLALGSNVVLVLIYTMFLLIGYRVDDRSANRLRVAIEGRVRRYLLTKVAVSGVTAVLVAVILAALRVDLWLLFGILAFGFNFIPSVGSIIATLVPVPVVLVDPDSDLTTLLLVLAIPGAIQFTIGNIIEPKLMGDSLDLHPVTVLVALIFWGSLWGVVGMLLAVPMTSVLKIILEETEITAPVARAMGSSISGPRAPAQ